jgi:hypothetical protein
MAVAQFGDTGFEDEGSLVSRSARAKRAGRPDERQ